MLSYEPRTVLLLALFLDFLGQLINPCWDYVFFYLLFVTVC